MAIWSKRWHRYAIGALGSLGLLASGGDVALAVRAGGKVYFNRPPALVDAETTNNAANAWGAIYYFTIAMPPDAGEPLARLVLRQQPNAETVEFTLSDTKAYARSATGDRQPLGVTATRDPDTGDIDLRFNVPVTAGQTAIVGLSPTANPREGGVYLFGVTAFPAGDPAYGQFLGYGRLHFHTQTRSSWGW